MDANQSVSLSPTQATPQQGNTISSTPIRAPLSLDSDFESALKTHTRTDSGSTSVSVQSFVDEEDGFLSGGEDGFETASENHLLHDQDDDTLELASLMDDDEDDVIVPVLAKPALVSSSLSVVPPKARVSGLDDDDDDVVDDDVDAGVDDTVVSEGGGGGSSEKIEIPVQDKVADKAAAAVSKEEVVPEIVEKVGDSVENPENGVLVSEEKVPSQEESPEELLANGAPDAVGVSTEAVVPSKNDVLPENPKIGLKEVLLDENPELQSGSVELVEESAPAVSEREVAAEALVLGKKDVLPENLKLSGVVNPEVGGVEKKEAEVIEEKEEVKTKGEVVEDKKGEEEVGGVKHEVSEEKNSEVVGVVEKEEAEIIEEKEELKTKDEIVEDKKGEEEVGGVKDEVSEEKNSEVVGVVEKEEAEIIEEKEELKTEDEIVEDKKGEEEVGVVNNEVSEEKNSETFTCGKDEASTEDSLPTASQSVEENGEVKSTSVEQVGEVKPNPVEINSDGVHDVEENMTSETKSPELEVDSSVVADVVPEQPLDVNDGPDDSRTAEMGSDIAKGSEENGVASASEKSLEPENGEISASEENLESVVRTQELVHEESKVEAPEAEKDDEENNDSSVAESVSLGSDFISEKSEPESESAADLGNKVSAIFESAVDGDDNALAANLDGPVDDQSEATCVKTEEANSVQEDTMPVVSTKSRDAAVASETDILENGVTNSPHASESEEPSSVFASEVKEEAEDEVDHLSYNDEEAESSVSDEELNFGSSGSAEQIMNDLMRGAGVGFNSGAESSQDGSQRIDGQILMDSDEEVDTDEEGEGKELFDSAALAALLKAATGAGSEGPNVTLTSQDGSRLFSVERPAGLGSSLRSLKPASQPSRPNIFTSSDISAGGESESVLSEEEKKKLEKLQHVRVKFLRLIHRLGFSPDEAIAAQVLYRMVLAAGRQSGPAFSLETAKKTAMQLEADKSEDLDFSLNVLVLGKTGVGKSATINSIFGEEKARIGSFEPGTTTVKEIIGTVGGVKIRVFDTPGLRSSVMEQAFNRRVLSSVKKLTKKYPLDILLYVDRLDTQTRDLNDLPLLRTITNTLGSSIWRSAVVTLTHAASAPPDGPSGTPLSYEVFVAQRSHIVQQSIGQAVGDLRMMNPSLMNPVSLVENHPSCRKNREGQRILPNGQSWRPQLLLLCYSLKVLSEVSSLSKPQDPFDHRKLFGFRVRAPPLPYLLSSLLQSRAHPKLPDDQGGENVDSDIDLEDLEESEQEEEEDEYDQLPPFKPLRKAQIAKLSKDQKKAYFEEYDYRVKLFQKKQWKEELKRMKEMKKKGKDQTDNADFVGEDAEQEGPAAVPVPLPDMVLPPSFDGDNPAYRYRFLEPTSQLLARPVLDTHGWDHDCGYDGVSLEENLAIAGRFPGGVAVQITKDKKEFNIHLDSSIAAKHGENGSTLAGFDIQTIGKQLGYIVRGETKFKNFKKNKTTGGISVTFLGENVATGVKVEDQISIGKRLTLVGSTGTIRSQGDMAYGANLEATLKDKDFPIGQDQSTLGLSLMKWRGDLALGANLQSQVSIGRSSKMSVRVGLNNKLSGQITVRTSSSEQLQLALVGILPIAISIYRSIWPSAGESFSAY